MSKSDFDDGIRYYLSLCGTMTQKTALIGRCKQKYPELNGRGVNFVVVPVSLLGEGWQWGFVVDPGRYHMSKPRIREAIDGLDDEVAAEIERQIDAYDPDKELLFCFICTLPRGCGSWVSLHVVG